MNILKGRLIKTKTSPAKLTLPFIAVSAVILTSVCSGDYSQIAFCWTSDYRIAPENRFLKVEADKNAVADSLIQWVTDQNAIILEFSESYPYTFRLHPEANYLFEQTQQIAQREWNSYDKNAYKKTGEQDWTKMLYSTAIQVIRENSNEQNLHLTILMAERKKTIENKENIKRISFPVVTDGYTVYFPWDERLNYPLLEKLKSEDVSIFSIINFYIFTNNDSIYIYASGAPYNSNKMQTANSTATIDYSLWPYVTGENEALLIKQAYKHLTQSYKTEAIGQESSIIANRPTAQLNSSWSDIFSGRISQVQSLIEQGANVNIIGPNNITPLYLSVQQGHSDMVKLLLDSGALVNIKSNDDVTPLYVAAQKGYPEIAKLLLDKGADTELKTKDKFTPLYVASAYGNTETVKVLLDNNADVNATDNNGWTALHIAASKGHIDTVKLLIDNKADPHKTTNQGYTPLALARKKGHGKIAEYLKQYN
jgi:ankyrin repeat protein